MMLSGQGSAANCTGQLARLHSVPFSKASRLTCCLRVCLSVMLLSLHPASPFCNCVVCAVCIRASEANAAGLAEWSARNAVVALCWISAGFFLVSGHDTHSSDNVLRQLWRQLQYSTDRCCVASTC